MLAALFSSLASLLHPGEENTENKSKTEGTFPANRSISMKNEIPEKIHQSGDGESQDKKEDKINEDTLDFHLTPLPEGNAWIYIGSNPSDLPVFSLRPRPQRYPGRRLSRAQGCFYAGCCFSLAVFFPEAIK